MVERDQGLAFRYELSPCDLADDAPVDSTTSVKYERVRQSRSMQVLRRGGSCSAMFCERAAELALGRGGGLTTKCDYSMLSTGPLEVQISQDIGSAYRTCHSTVVVVCEAPLGTARRRARQRSCLREGENICAPGHGRLILPQSIVYCRRIAIG